MVYLIYKVETKLGDIEDLSVLNVQLWNYYKTLKQNQTCDFLHTKLHMLIWKMLFAAVYLTMANSLLYLVYLLFK